MMYYVATIREQLIQSLKPAIGKSLSVNLNPAKTYSIFNSLDYPLEILIQERSEIHLSDILVLLNQMENTIIKCLDKEQKPSHSYS